MINCLEYQHFPSSVTVTQRDTLKESGAGTCARAIMNACLPGRLTQMWARCSIALGVWIFQMDDQFSLKLPHSKVPSLLHLHQAVAFLENVEDM